MKVKIIFINLFLTLFIFSSCSNENRIGNWKVTDASVPLEYPKTLKFTKDSICIEYPYFNIDKTYKLDEVRGKYRFNNLHWKTKILYDTLIVNDRIKYYKTKTTSYLPKLELPNISSDSLFKEKFINGNDMLMAYTLGRKDGIPLIQINDTLISLSGIQQYIMEFMAIMHGDLSRPNIFLFIDKKIKMRDVEKLFFEIVESNMLRLQLVNSIDFNDENRSFDEYSPIWQYETLDCRLMPIFINEQYYRKVYKVDFAPPPPPSVPEILISANDIEEIFLIENEIFHGNKKISKAELYTLAVNFIKDNKTIFTLYDLESSYDYFLEFNSIIRSVYDSKREALSNRIFEKPLKDLVNEEKRRIRDEVPMFHFWQFSKDYYEDVIRNANVESSFKVLQN